MLSVNLSRDLRKKHNKRNVPVRKGDKVKIMRGKFRSKQGKVTDVKTRMMKIYVEGIQVKKTEGSKASIPMRASNLQIVELNLEDQKRFRKLAGKKEAKETKENKQEKKETKEVKKEKSKEKVKEDKKK